jgi:hypothetical protein
MSCGHRSFFCLFVRIFLNRSVFDSYKQAIGKSLFEIDSKLLPGVAEILFETPFVLLSHGTITTSEASGGCQSAEQFRWLHG